MFTVGNITADLHNWIIQSELLRVQGIIKFTTTTN